MNKLVNECTFIPAGAAQQSRSLNAGAEGSRDNAVCSALHGDCRTAYIEGCLVKNEKYHDLFARCRAGVCEESCIEQGYIIGVCWVPNRAHIYEKCYCEKLKE